MTTGTEKPLTLDLATLAKVHAVKSQATWTNGASKHDESKMPFIGDHTDKSAVHAQRATMIAAIEQIEQLLSGSIGDDALTQRLRAALEQLRGALQGGMLSKEAVAAILTNAANAIGAAAAGSGPLLQPEILTAISPADFWDQHHKQQAMVDRAIDAAVDGGCLDKKTRDKLKAQEDKIDKLAAEIEKMPEGKEKDKANDALLKEELEFYHDDIEAMKRARLTALATGKKEIAATLDKAISWQQQSYKGLQQQHRTETSVPENVQEHSSSIGQIGSQSNIPNVVSDWGDPGDTTASHNNIEVPKVGKKPSSNGNAIK